MSQSTSILLLGGAKAEASRLRRALSRHFLLVETARDVEEARQLAARCRFDALVLVDPESPWERMQKALDECDQLPSEALIITERARAEIALDALRDGACDALLRPVPNDALVAALNRVIDGRSRRGLAGKACARDRRSTAVPELPSTVADRAPATPQETLPVGYPLDWTLEQAKRHHMIRVLDASGGNRTLAARRLEISRKTLERKLGTRSPD